MRNYCCIQSMVAQRHEWPVTPASTLLWCCHLCPPPKRRLVTAMCSTDKRASFASGLLSSVYNTQVASIVQQEPQWIQTGPDHIVNAHLGLAVHELRRTRSPPCWCKRHTYDSLQEFWQGIECRLQTMCTNMKSQEYPTHYCSFTIAYARPKVTSLCLI